MIFFWGTIINKVESFFVALKDSIFIFETLEDEIFMNISYLHSLASMWSQQHCRISVYVIHELTDGLQRSPT